MDFRPLNDIERRNLITALRGNGDGKGWRGSPIETPSPCAQVSRLQESRCAVTPRWQMILVSGSTFGLSFLDKMR
jgi:hypothetical protein